ncbi:MAG: hypothetical protein OZ929_19715, partial [Bryobacterales bacterium]|nr:hypothetical protein [Bryobacterales bacterium]
ANGYAPWVKILHARAGLAVLQGPRCSRFRPCHEPQGAGEMTLPRSHTAPAAPSNMSAARAEQIYLSWIHRTW